MNKPIKIGLITHNFPNSEKERINAGIFSYDLAKVLSKKAKVVVFSPGENMGQKKIGGIETYFFKFTGKLGSLKLYNPLHLFKFIMFFIDGKRALHSFIRENPDLNFIISMWAFPGGDFARYISKRYKIPYAVYCLGSDIYIYAQKPILKTLIKNYLSNAEFILADGIDLAVKTKKLSGKKVQFLPSGSSFPAMAFGRKKKAGRIFTFLGRLEKVKGVDLFVDALNILSIEKVNFQANIIGDGSLKKWITQKISNKNIVVWGNINEKEKIARILTNSDWLVIPSRSESIPLVFSESLKVSLPIIASDLPDLKYLVKKYKIGYLFKKNDSGDLANVLKKALADENDYPDFRNNTKKAAKLFDLNKSSVKLINLIRNKL